ncbi:MAG: hypothetical protein LBL41_01560 [Bifidobacteriaceae bacterium]|jgi:uncharacterized membrane protein|nr:hypothetical protein [Bifidobacteriaceae bacterium]
MQKFGGAIKTVLSVAIAIILVVLSVQSFLFTTAKYGNGYDFMPLVFDNFVMEILGQIVILVLIYVVLKRTKGVSTRRVMSSEVFVNEDEQKPHKLMFYKMFNRFKPLITFQNVALFIIFLQALFYIALVGHMVVYDAADIYNAARSDASIAFNGYFNRQQHQIGMYVYEKLIFLLSFGNEWLADAIFVLINALAPTIGFYNMFRTSRLIFKEPLVTRILICLSVLALPVIAQSWTLYGLTFMFPIFATAFYLATAYFVTQNNVKLIQSAVVLGIGAILKPNAMIGVVAFVIFAIYFVTKFKKPLLVTSAVAIVICLSVFAPKLINIAFGITGPATTPISQLAIGTEIRPVTHDKYPNFPEGYEYYIYGFYNGASYYYCEDSNLHNNRDAYHKCVAENNAIQEAQFVDNLSYIANHPKEALEFFVTKQAIQWGAASFGVLTYPTLLCEPNSSIYSCWVDDPLRLSFVGGGLLYEIFNFFADAHQLIIYVFAAAGAFALRRKPFINYLFPITFLGGYLFYTISEMKSNYAIPFFAMLLPVAAYGIYVSLRRFVRE